jgi:hypothetical protein
MPIMLPALALVSGKQVTTEVRCHASCHGTASLHLSGSSTTLAHVNFKVTGSSIATLHLTLSSAGSAKLAAVKQLTVQLTVVVTVGSGRPTTFTSSLELTHKLPATTHTKAKSKPAKSKPAKSKQHSTRSA